jgi:hypothetical protein
MCGFLSAIAFKDGSVKCEPMLDHHSDLVRLFGLRDDAENEVVRRFAKVEFTPPAGRDADWLDLYSWELVCDEHTEPEWWAGRCDKVLAAMRAQVESMIVRDKRDIVVGGCWILAPGAKITKLVSGRIVCAKGANMRVADMRGANMREADMRGADMRGADMRGADMWDANMRGADMRVADMRGANMREADMRGADMRVADMREADMRGADMWDALRPHDPPAGWEPDKSGRLQRKAVTT